MQYHNINAGGELDGHSPRWTSPRQTGKGRSRERAALDAPRRSPSPKTAPKQRQTTPRRGEGKVAFKEFDPNLIPDAPRPASRGLSPRGSLAALPVATPLAWLDALPMRPSRVSRFPGGFGCCTDAAGGGKGGEQPDEQFRVAVAWQPLPRDWDQGRNWASLCATCCCCTCDRIRLQRPVETCEGFALPC